MISDQISIIIPNYNGLIYLKRCLDSIYQLNTNNFEIIVVDNGSSDRSVDYILNNYKDVILIELDQNYGFSKAVNDAIKLSHNEFVILLNNDTVVDKYWLENLVQCIKKDEKIFSCCSKMIRYDDQSKIDDAGDSYTILGWAYKIGDGESSNKRNRDKRVFSCCAGAAIYRKKIFDEIGFFDESFFAYMEDIDISYRANIYGYKNVYCSNAIVYHVGSATSGSKYNSFKVRLTSRNNIYVIVKNMPILQLIINIPYILLGWIIKCIFFYRKGYLNEYIQGSKEGLKTLNNISTIKYKNKNFMSYVYIELVLILSTFKYIFRKLINLLS